MTRLSQKKCAYCGDIANSKDHVPTKSLLETPYPVNLMTIPACSKCNESFAKDEEYLLNVLVETTTNPTLLLKKESGGKVYKARTRSIGLAKRISKSLVPNDDGRIYFAPEYDRIKRVVEKIAFGLFVYRYHKLPSIHNFQCIGLYPYSVIEMRPEDLYLLTYSGKFVSKKWTIIQDEVFSYIVVRDWIRNNKLTMILNIHNSIWCVIAIPTPTKIDKAQIKARQKGLLF